MTEALDGEPTRLVVDAEEDVQAPVLLRRSAIDSSEADMSPMIDMTFLLLIFFIVCSTMSLEREVALPPAEFGVGVSSKTATIITMVAREGAGPEVYVGEAEGGSLLPDDPQQQEEQVAAAVEEGFGMGQSNVLIKAERTIKHRDVSRIASAAGRIEGVKLNLAVMEADLEE
jgi:biopolymer transport protein ExbD